MGLPGTIPIAIVASGTAATSATTTFTFSTVGSGSLNLLPGIVPVADRQQHGRTDERLLRGNRLVADDPRAWRVGRRRTAGQRSGNDVYLGHFAGHERYRHHLEPDPERPVHATGPDELPHRRHGLHLEPVRRHDDDRRIGHVGHGRHTLAALRGQRAVQDGHHLAIGGQRGQLRRDRDGRQAQAPA